MRHAFEYRIVFIMIISTCDSIFSFEENFEDTEQALHPSLLLQATSIPTNSCKRKSIDPSVVATRPGIKPSKPSGGSARARLGGLHARFCLLGGVTLSLGLGSVRLSSPIGCSGSARPNRTEQQSCLLSAEFALRNAPLCIPGF